MTRWLLALSVWARSVVLFLALAVLFVVAMWVSEAVDEVVWRWWRWRERRRQRRKGAVQ